MSLKSRVPNSGHATEVSLPGEASSTRPSAQGLNTRPVYRHSVIRGGAFSAAELEDSLRGDPVVNAHYVVFNKAKLRMTRMNSGSRVYVSYRVGDVVYWTRHRVQISSGEVLLTDGSHLARARCGNRISRTPQQPVALQEPGTDLDFTEVPPELGHRPFARPYASPLPSPLIAQLFAPAPPDLLGQVTATPTNGPLSQTLSSQGGGLLSSAGSKGGAPPTLIAPSNSYTGILLGGTVPPGLPEVARAPGFPPIAYNWVWLPLTPVTLLLVSSPAFSTQPYTPPGSDNFLTGNPPSTSSTWKPPPAASLAPPFPGPTGIPIPSGPPTLPTFNSQPPLVSPVDSVPEPGTGALLVVGTIAAAVWRVRRSRA